MIEKALVDGDILVYRNAAATENEDENIAKWQLDQMIHRIMQETNAMSNVIYLTGSNNFRLEINPEYKANRKDLPKPRHYSLLREHLVEAWNAKVTDGIEADDALGIDQCAEELTCICSIDKDLLMIPGQHYNFVKREFRLISPLEGLRNFYFQLIMGDRTDNIFGYDGKARATVPKFLEPYIDELQSYQDEQDMYDFVLDMYKGDKDRMHMNAHCLWILRKENERWQPPSEKETE